MAEFTIKRGDTVGSLEVLLQGFDEDGELELAEERLQEQLSGFVQIYKSLKLRDTLSVEQAEAYIETLLALDMKSQAYNQLALDCAREARDLILEVVSEQPRH